MAASKDGEEDGEQRRWRPLLHKTAPYLPEINFITIHYGFFICTILLAALVFWGSSTPFKSVSFVDSLFLCASAITESGLNTINLSTLNTFQQFLLFFLIIIGSAIFVSIFVLFVRLRAFEKEFKHSIKQRRDMREKSRADARESVRRPHSRRRDARTTDADSPHLQSKYADTYRPSSVVETESSEKTAGSVAKEPLHPSGELTAQESQSAEPKLSDNGSRCAPGSQVDDVGGRSRSRSIKFESSPGATHDNQGASNAVHIQRPGSPPSLNSRQTRNASERVRHPLVSFSGVGATVSSNLRPRAASCASSSRTQATLTQHPLAVQSPSSNGVQPEPVRKSAAGFFMRNSSVYGLSIEQRQHLGGCEYSAILLLSFVVPLYWTLFQLLGAVALGAWIQNHRPGVARANGINPFWVGAFNAISAFNNSGMSLLDANMTAFQDSYFLLLSMGFFILAGNTAYPIFLRMIIWVLHRVLPDNDFWRFDKETLEFLLTHPRRCYTNLFPSRHTCWLGGCLVALNGMDWAMFEILNIGNPNITKSLSTRIEVLDGFFQALAVRSGGFYVVTITNTRIALQVLYVIMMYISAYPVAITMRNSNVYEERSLGIYAEDFDRREVADTDAGRTRLNSGSKEGQSVGGRLRRIATAARTPRRQVNSRFLRQQLRAQLSHDTWWIALAVFLIMVIEGARFESDPTVFSCFNVIFEVVSGYGCVGISTGVPWAAFSFCGAWHSLSKLVLTAVMIRGRHRGLPVAIDHAVQLPDHSLWLAEEDDGRRRLERSWTLREGQV